MSVLEWKFLAFYQSDYKIKIIWIYVAGSLVSYFGLYLTADKLQKWLAIIFERQWAAIVKVGDGGLSVLLNGKTPLKYCSIYNYLPYQPS